MLPRILLAALVASAALFVPANADQAQPAVQPLKQRADPFTQTTDRVIVQLREPDPDRVQPLAADRTSRLSALAGTELAPVRRMSDGAHVLTLGTNVPLAEAERVAKLLRRDSQVLHAEPDRRKRPLQATSERFDLQWNLREATGGINVEQAWANVSESTSVRVAVIDTGILFGHPDLPANRLLDGFDFVSLDSGGSALTANDGNGREDNEADPGNWVSASDQSLSLFSGCQIEDSDWHGTHISGIIAAQTNSIGIRGINRDARILPVRALGKCGGYTSDILDAMRWAAGISVGGVRANTTPTQIINLSLGGEGDCSKAEQDTINEVLNAGVRAIVVAAGNENTDVSASSPANCAGVIAVAATDRNGSLAAYSNKGQLVHIAAPGGYFVVGGQPENGILSLFNNGKTSPQPFPTASDYAWVQGTSEAAAHVSGVVSLMLSKNPNLSATQVRSVLRTSARAFPNSSCTTCTCGAGILDAGKAVSQSTSPPADPGAGSCSSDGGGNLGGGGGGGGCVLAHDARPDAGLLLLLAAALLALARRRWRVRCAR